MTEIHEQVRRVFNNLNTDHDELLSRDQILRFLDRTSQELYDRAIFEQLYVRIQKGNNGYICIKDFIKVLFDGLDSLRNKITKIEDELVEKKDSLQIISQKYQAIAKKERFNNQGLSLESMVQVTILDAEILFPTGATLYWIVGCDKQKLQTTQATRESPVWNQALEFTITTGQESLWLVLLDETSIQRDDLCGQAQVQISQFEDQKKHKLTLDLHDRANNLLNARVHLVVQWIHSQTKFIEEQIQEQQLQMQELNFDLDEYKKDLKAMFKPFQKPIANNKQPNALEHSFAQQTPELTIQRIHEPKNESEDFLNLAVVGTLLYLLVILLASLVRNLYLDMLVLFYIIFFFRNNSEIQSMLHIKIMAGLLIATLLSDIIWLSIFTKPWVSKKVVGTNPEDTMYQYEIIITFILDCIKVLLLLVLLYIYRLNPEKRVDIQDEQYVKIFRPNEQVVKTEIIPISPVTQSRYISQPQVPYQVPTVRQYQTFQPYQEIQIIKSQLMEARAEVKRVFNLLSTDHDELIPRENILRFLDQQGHELYDRSVFEQLYHRTQKGKHGYITISDFIQAMFDGLDSLKNKVYKVQDSLFEKQKQLADLNAKYQQVLKTERYNDYDISTQSMIQVTIADALLDFDGSANVYFELGCFKQKQQSQKIPKSNPIWDECFEFNVSTGKEQLWLIILDEATPANEVIGQVNLDVMQFYDQLKHRLTLDMKDRANMIVTARVNVIIQWIHSQSKYFESLITIAQHEVQQYQFDIDEFKKDIKALFNPFNQLQQMHAYMSSQFQQREKVTAYGQPQKLEVHYSKYYETEDFMKVSIFGTLLYLVGVLLASLDKTCFFDLLVLAYILLFFRNNARLASLLHIKIILVMLAVAIIYDVIWLYFYTRPWTTAKTVYQPEDTLEQYEVILTFILIFLKLLLMAINFWIYKLNPDKSPDVFDVQYRLLFKEEKPENQLIVPVTQVMQSQYVLQPPLKPTKNKFPAF